MVKKLLIFITLFITAITQAQSSSTEQQLRTMAYVAELTQQTELAQQIKQLLKALEPKESVKDFLHQHALTLGFGALSIAELYRTARIAQRNPRITTAIASAAAATAITYKLKPVLFDPITNWFKANFVLQPQESALEQPLILPSSEHYQIEEPCNSGSATPVSMDLEQSDTSIETHYSEASTATSAADLIDAVKVGQGVVIELNLVDTDRSVCIKNTGGELILHARGNITKGKKSRDLAAASDGKRLFIKDQKGIIREYLIAEGSSLEMTAVRIYIAK